MLDTKVVLVTGVAGYWGGKTAARLLALNEAKQEVSGGESRLLYHVIGVDSEPPKAEIKGLDFIQADVRNPLLIEVLETEQVDTVVHLGFLETTRPSEKAFDLNVIGAMKVLGAAAEAGVRKVVLRSSTMVYGAQPSNPAFLTEEQALNGSKANGTILNFTEIEAFLNGFRRQSPEMIVTVLRFANVVGPEIDSPMTRYLKLALPRVLLGFDPLTQVLHERDAVAALVYCVENDAAGVFNVAAEGSLPLAKILGLSGRLPLPVLHWFAYFGNSFMKAASMPAAHYYPIEPDYLRYSWVTDLRRMREELGFTPEYTGEETLREFAGHLRLKKYRPESPDLDYDEERLRDTLERRKRQRGQTPATAAAEDV